MCGVTGGAVTLWLRLMKEDLFLQHVLQWPQDYEISCPWIQLSSTENWNEMKKIILSYFSQTILLIGSIILNVKIFNIETF